MLQLLATYDGTEHIFELPEEAARLGRGEGNQIVLRAKGVSRRHALVRHFAGGVEVLDTKSTNGLVIAGERVSRAVLTPGLRLQVGTAWLEVVEASSSASILAHLARSTGRQADPASRTTAPAPPEADPRTLSPTEAALTLAYHIARVGAGVPGNRFDLILRVGATLQAEAFTTLDRRLRGKLRLWEKTGEFSRKEVEHIDRLAKEGRPAVPGQVCVSRSGTLLVAGRQSWYLATRFADEAMAREAWRKDLLHFLAQRLFLPVRQLDAFMHIEVQRVFALTRLNVSRTAALLKVCPNWVRSHLQNQDRSKS